MHLQTRVVLLDLFGRKARRLGIVGPLVVDQCGADGVGCRENRVLARDTEVVSRSSVADIALLRTGVDTLVQVSEVADADMGPDVGSCVKSSAAGSRRVKEQKE